MRFVCPRVICANRGDLLSRYGILSALQEMGINDIAVFCHQDQHIAPLPYPTVSYGRLYNLLPHREGLHALRRSDIVLWTAGLDLQDDSSLLKLVHTLCVFASYRLMGLRIYVLMQGAGPLKTRWGKRLTRRILNLVDVFVARDRGTLSLLQQLQSKARLVLGYDGIFLGEFNPNHVRPEEAHYITALTDKSNGQPLIGFNLRLWFHFTSSLLPYQFAKATYQARSKEKMKAFVQASTRFLSELRQKLNARIFLISMYEPDIEPWEDDVPYLQQVKADFAQDDDVIVINKPLGIHGFCRLMSQMDLMVGTRLHSTLTAMRFGVPAINLSYTLKGKDIYDDLGLADRVIEVEDFISNPEAALELTVGTLQNGQAKEQVQEITSRVIQHNQQTLNDLMESS